MTLEEFIDKNPSFKYKADMLKDAGFDGEIDTFKLIVYLIKHGDAKTVKALIDADYHLDGTKQRDFR